MPFVIGVLVWEWVLKCVDGPLSDTDVLSDTDFDALVREGAGEGG
jgi:hypothetical protein